MGVPIGTETVNLELRYSAIEVSKDMQTGNIIVNIPYQIGFYDANGNWVVKEANQISATGDAAMVLFGVKPADLGATDQTPIGEIINTLAYAAVTEQVQLTASIVANTITSTDTTVAPPDSVFVEIQNAAGQAVVVRELTVGVPTAEFPVVLNATVTFSAPGFDPITMTFPILQGQVAVDLAFTPTPADTTTTV